MSRNKKSRKPGPLAAPRNSPKGESESVSRARKKLKKHKGLVPGSRNAQIEGAGGGPRRAGSRGDPRFGSTKPVALHSVIADNSTRVEVEGTPLSRGPSLRSLQQELQRLEQDERLNALLDMVDRGGQLNAQEQTWLDGRLARHQELMTLLGLTLEDDEPQQDEDEVLLERFMNQGWEPPMADDIDGNSRG